MQDTKAIRELLEMDVEFALLAEFDDMPVRGNALVSGDDALDRKVEDELIDRINSGDVWAWAAVTVTASWNGFEGSDHLGGCSYQDEEDFKAGGYYDDMKAEALDRLNEEIAAAAECLEALRV